MAVESKEFNLKDGTFCELFPDTAEQLLREADERAKLAKQRTLDNAAACSQSSPNVQTDTNHTDPSTSASRHHDNNEPNGHLNQAANNANNNNNGWLGSLLGNVFVMLALAIFAFLVKYIVTADVAAAAGANDSS